MKIRLRDDPPATATCRTFGAVSGALADDAPSTVEPATLLPTLTVSTRRRGEPNEDGDPTWTWSVLFSGTAILWTASETVDPVAGVITATAKAVALYAGGAVVDETCSVESSHGGTWRPVKVAQLPDRVEFTLTRTWQAASEEAA